MNQSPFDTMRTYEKDFTRTDHKIAKYLESNATKVISYSIAWLASNIGVSEAALIRFAKKIAYTGFSALKNDIARFLFSQNAAHEVSQNEENDSPLVSIPRIYARYISAIPEMVDIDTVERIAKLFLKSKRVKILGSNRTFHAVRQLRYRLCKIGFDAEAMEDMFVFDDMTDYLGKDDLAIIFTTKNNLRYDSIAEHLHRHKTHLVVFTMIQNLPFRKYCDEVVVLPRISRDSGMTFLDDQAIYFVFIEVLLDVIASQARELEKE